MAFPLTRQGTGKLFVLLGILAFLTGAAVKHKTILLNGVDFKTVYSSSKCLLDGCNPYDSTDLLREYIKGHGDTSRGSDLSAFRPYQAIYPPSSLFWVLPFAALPWKPAILLWVSISGFLFATAAWLISDLCAASSSPLPQILLGLFVATSTMLLTTAQPSGVAISLCAIGVWSLIENRATTLGSICFALSIALKPQIGGLILLYFLLAGGARRSRAIVILLASALFCVPGLVWSAHVPAAAHWVDGLRTNLAGSAVRGNLNDPGPTSFNSSMVTDLQSVVAVFDDVPRIYNPVSWAIVGSLLLPWAYVAWQAPSSRKKDVLGVAAIACLSLLPIYHRHYDVRLLIVSFPAVALLIRESRRTAIVAVLASLAVIGGSHPSFFRDHFGLHRASWGPLKTILLLHTSPLVLFCCGVFYLVCFVQTSKETTPAPLPLQRDHLEPSLDETTLVTARGRF